MREAAEIGPQQVLVARDMLKLSMRNAGLLKASLANKARKWQGLSYTDVA